MQQVGISYAFPSQALQLADVRCVLPEVPIPDFMPICPHPVAPLSLTKAFASAEEDDVVFEQGVISMNDLEEVVKLLECKDLEPML